LNSIFSLAYIFCGKEETTERYVHGYLEMLSQATPVKR
jgi:hypothetical protein